MTDLDLVRPVGRGQTPAGRGPTLVAERSRLAGWTRAALRDVLYTVAVGVWSIAVFSILVTGLAVTASLLILVVGVLVWIGFVYAMRWTTWVDRTLAGWQRREPVRASYRRPPVRGVGSWVRTLSSDPQTWRDMAWMAVTSVIGFASGLAVVTGVGVAGAYLTMPLWFWAVQDPTAHAGLTDVGGFTVDGPGRAAVMSVAGLVLIPVVLLLARSCATGHVRLAVRLLGPRSPSRPA